MAMIDPKPNPNRECWADGVEPTEINGLIQARIDGKISRRDLIRRATRLGIAAPVVGIMLHATSDYAFGAPNPARSPLAARAQDKQTIPATQPTAPEGTPQDGGTVVYGAISEPDTMHPWVTQLLTTNDIYTAVNEKLLQYDSTQTMQPALAESYQISEDGLTYTFALRQGVKWHDGTDFTAQDFIDSWKMIMNPDFGAWSQLGFDKITDAHADGTNLVVVTSEPYAPFLSYVAAETVLCPSSAMAAGAQEFKEAFGRSLIGTGPMKFIEWKSGESITLERNPDYWGGAPKLDQIIVTFLPDDNTQLVQLRTGEIQLVGGDGALSANRVDEALGIDGIIILENTTLGWNHLDLKNIDFLREQNVRLALDYATPTQDIIDKILKGRATRSIGDVAPGTPYFNDQIQPRPYDPEKAKQLLDEAGLVAGDGGVRERDGKKFEMELWATTGSSQTEQIIQVIAKSWNDIGVKTEAKFEDVSTIWGPEGYQFTDKMTACSYSWFNSNDPDDMFYWHSSQIPTSPTGTGGNLPAYFFPFNFQAEIDDLTSRAAAETDQAARIDLYKQIQVLLYDQAAVIFMYWGKDFPAVTTKLGGYWPSAYNRLLWNVKDWYLVQ